ncbi:MAG: hypothetical protein JWM71_163 [Solirubrobacteraceae bacterium]|nr:hypothetical protein [Solirubrobacteraceae bacterium]
MTGRDRLIVAVLGMLAVVAAAWFLAVAPKRQQADNLAKQVAAAQRQRDDVSRQAQGAAAARHSYDTDAAALATLGEALPTDDQTASLLYQLDAAAGRSRVQLKSITPSSGTAAAPATPAVTTTSLPAGVAEVPVSLTFEGRYADFERFLRKVRSYTDVRGKRIAVRGRLLNVKSVQLTVLPSKAGQISATVDASVYVVSATAPSTATAGTPAPGTSASTPAPASGSPVPPTTPAAIGAGG